MVRSRSNAPVRRLEPCLWRDLAVGLSRARARSLVLVFFALRRDFLAGIAATCLMGLGTAITVATIAVVAVSARFGAGLALGREGVRHVVMRGIEFGGGGTVAAVRARLLLCILPPIG